MRVAFAAAAGLILAGCSHTREAPDTDEAPDTVVETRIEPGDAHRLAGLQRCLFVFNHTGETVAVFADGRHVGWVGPRSTAGLFVGRSAGVHTKLLATCRAGSWTTTIRGPVWTHSWHLR